MTTILFVFAIFVSIWMGIVTFGLMFRKAAVPALNFILLSAALTAVITHFMGVW